MTSMVIDLATSNLYWNQKVFRCIGYIMTWQDNHYLSWCEIIVWSQW